jgi:pimeloyl-ACP methyl ester carboxylesterase
MATFLGEMDMAQVRAAVEAAGDASVGLANTLRGVQLRRPTMYELEGRLRELRVPRLVIVGEEDTPALDASRFLANTIPDATLTVLPRTGTL